MTDEKLSQLQDALKEKRTGIFAPQLARTLKCSLPTIYRRIEALVKEGAVIAEVKERREKTGPTPRKFVLMKSIEF